jgi:hypothetical protein
MSFDLRFYHSNELPVSKVEIENYLNNLLPADNKESRSQWWYENDDIEVYFSFGYDTPEQIAEDEDYDGYADTGFSFNINFLRPDFFGLEAFCVVRKFLDDLNLLVVNPQIGSESDGPHKPTFEGLYKSWSDFNYKISADHFIEMESSYYLLDISNKVWQYNFNRSALQKQLGEQYFVPRIFFLKTKADNKVVTLATWTEHIPCVIPPADFYLLVRQYKKWFKTVKDTGMISYSSLVKTFGNYFDDFEVDGCKIIHPENAEKIASKFNDIKLEYDLGSFAERIGMDKLFNNRPL